MRGKKLETITTETGCIIITSHTSNRKGYPAVGVGRHGMETRSRRIYRETHGEIPNGMIICHTCDNPACINIDHLFLGTWKDNQQDASRKGRRPSGEAHHGAKLKEKDIIKIRASKLTTRALAREYNVRQSTIWEIVARKTWRNVKEE